MKILIAPNAFKNSLSAREVAEAIQQGLEESALQSECLLQPIADGGDGMLDVLIGQGQGRKLYAVVQNPLGRPVRAAYGLIHQGKTGVIEMAEASGIRLLRPEELNPLLASTYGTGELIRLLLDEGVEKIIIGVGGSATVDAGLGMAAALGARLTDAAGQDIPPGAQGLEQLSAIDLSAIDPRLQHTEVLVTCDVDTSLQHSAEVFGPQKGATSEMVVQISQWLKQYSTLVKNTVAKDIYTMKAGGAAGGISATLHALFNARLVEGTSFLLSQTSFYQQLSQADLLITAEGALDLQTQSGKGPFYVAQQAKDQQKPVIMLAGSLPQPFSQSGYAVYDAVFSIGARPEKLQDAIAHTRPNLIRTSRQIGNLLALRLFSS